MQRLRVHALGMDFASPLVAAAGTCGYLDELSDALDLRTLGAVTTKSITRESRDGNKPWRIIGAKGGMLNAVGLANVGVEAFVREKWGHASRVPCRIIGSIAGHSVEDYAAVVRAFDGLTGMAAIEINASCPNTATGLQFSDSPELLRGLTATLRALTTKPLIVKLTPNTGDIVGLARGAIDGGADGLTLINTVQAMAIDPETRRTRLSRGKGGLSGPAIHPIAVRMVHDVYTQVARDAGKPIIGLGGVMDWRDAAELVLAGATLVGMGTSLFVDPSGPATVARDLDAWVRRQGASTIADLVGAVDMSVPDLT